MGNNSFRLLFTILCISLLMACSKKESDIEARLISRGAANSIIYDLSISNHKIITAGGDVWVSGVVGYLDSLDNYSSSLIHTQSMFAIACDDELCLIVGNYGIALWSGTLTQWSKLDNTSQRLLKGAMLTEDYMYAVGGHGYGNGVIHRWNRDGTNRQNFTTVEELRDIEITSDGRLVVVGFGVIYVSDDQGLNWKVQDVENDFYKAITKDLRGNLYGIGWSGTILKSEDNASTWQTIARNGALSESKKWNDVEITNQGELVIVGEEGLVEFYNTQGSQLESLQIDQGTDLYSVIVDQNRMLAAGASESIYELTR